MLYDLQSQGQELQQVEQDSQEDSPGKNWRSRFVHRSAEEQEEIMENALRHLPHEFDFIPGDRESSEFWISHLEMQKDQDDLRILAAEASAFQREQAMLSHSASLPTGKQSSLWNLW